MKGIYINFIIISNFALFLLIYSMSNSNYSYGVIFWTIFISVMIRKLFTSKKINGKKQIKITLYTMIIFMYLGLFAVTILLKTDYQNMLEYICILTSYIYLGFVYLYFDLLFSND